MDAISTASHASTVTLPTSGSSQANTKPAATQPAKVHVKAHTAQPQKQEKPITEQDVQKAVRQATLDFAGQNESIGFSYEKKLGQMFVVVTDNQSGEVIREFPSKDFIQHRLAMREMIGLILDKQA